MSISTDGSIVIRTRRGEIDAYGALVNHYQDLVFNICYRLLGEWKEAEDFTQETFIRAYHHLDSYDVTRPFGPWIRRVATNLCFNQIQRKQSKQDREMDDERLGQSPSGLDDPEAITVRSERSQMIRSALVKLPDHYRIAIELRHFQDLTYQEMADEMNLPLNTVKSHLYRARKRLAEIITGKTYV
jgi:RNA polymerase sigma-70 factor (ECF subfamily)